MYAHLSMLMQCFTFDMSHMCIPLIDKEPFQLGNQILHSKANSRRYKLCRMYHIGNGYWNSNLNIENKI